ncbi:amino acid/amide ABC transporter ATP-binding protein 1, HAAT family [Mesorhizobium australicum]|uniref:Amino acid/amide ABC transporter ATP-binding protein 1, HAAT family n=2 Tax=Mesorhizobium australicum TaxID=536018 RepID=A0A1X7MUK3_9HYPH|nr:amino acid/amide ABC transporter ATP-binding protein 1, HAAT family [Mesorhizobium australicum]
MIAGFLKPDSGSVAFCGESITGKTPEEIARIGMVRTFQITQPFAGLSVVENIQVGAFMRERNRRLAEIKAREVGTRLGLDRLLDTPAAGLTVAARKRLEVARVLATDPQLILLDEVMAGLNPTEINETVRMVKTVRDTGITIVLIEHVMQAVAELAEDTYVLAEGRLIARGTPREIANNPKVIESYLGQGASKRIRHA